METTGANFITVPLNKLAISPKNVRQTLATSIDDLLASIPVHGLLQSLVVEQGEKDGHYLVIAGGRRLRALKALAKTKVLQKDYVVPCKLAEGDFENLSLAENVIRAAMHPADQFEAFVAQIESGKTVEDVASMYGVSETVIKKRLKLGRVAPKILATYKAGKIEYNEVAAYAVSDDHERQLAVFKANPNAHSHNIRRALTEGEIPGSDKRARFVGIEAYAQAGGEVRQDLFAEQGKDFYLVDVALLDRLFDEKMTALCTEIRAEGWSNVSHFTGSEHSISDHFRGRVYEQLRQLSEIEQARQAVLSEQLEELSNALEADPDNAELRAAGEAAELELETLTQQQFAPEDIARAEAAVYFDWNGNLKIRRGLLLNADKGSSGTAADKATPAVDAHGVPLPSQAMRDELAAVRTTMVAADLAQSPHVALAATVHGLAVALLWQGYCRAEPAVQIKASVGMPWSLFGQRPMRPLMAMAEKRDALRNTLPQQPNEWFAHFLGQSDAELMAALAVLAALSLRSYGFVGAGVRSHADQLAEAVTTIPEQWVTLSELDFLQRANKKQILTAIEQVHGRAKADNMAGMKKAALVEAAIGFLDGKWLPSQLSAFASASDRQSLNEVEHTFDQDSESEDDESDDIDGEFSEGDEDMN